MMVHAHVERGWLLPRRCSRRRRSGSRMASSLATSSTLSLGCLRNRERDMIEEVCFVARAAGFSFISGSIDISNTRVVASRSVKRTPRGRKLTMTDAGDARKPTDNQVKGAETDSNLKSMNYELSYFHRSVEHTLTIRCWTPDQPVTSSCTWRGHSTTIALSLL